MDIERYLSKADGLTMDWERLNANRSGGTFARGGSSTPYGNLQEDAMSDQTDLIRGTLDLLTMRTIALEPRLSAGVDLVLERT